MTQNNIVRKSTKSSRNQKTAGWIRENHSQIDAAASLYGRSWTELGLTTKGAVIAVITKALYRIGRRPGFKLNLESMHQMMERDTIVKEVEHQLNLGESQQEEQSENAQKARQILVASVVRKANVPNADELVQRLINWLTLIPGLTNTQQVMTLCQLYIAQAGALKIIRPPASDVQIDELARRSPARIVRPQRGVTYLVLKNNEEVDWTRGHTRITEQSSVAA